MPTVGFGSLQERVKPLGWIESNSTIPFDEVASGRGPLEEMLGMMDEQSTPLPVRPGRFELSILLKRVTDESLDVSINDMLGDVTHLLTDDLRTRRKSGEDIIFWASSDKEAKVTWKGVAGNFVGDGAEELSAASTIATLIEGVNDND